MNPNNSQLSVFCVNTAQFHSEETGRSTASKPLSARAGNDSNSSSDFQLQSGGGRTENTGHICNKFSLRTALLFLIRLHKVYKPT